MVSTKDSSLCPSLISFCILCLQDPSRLEGRVTLRQMTAGSVVAHQGDQVSVPAGEARLLLLLRPHIILSKMHLHLLVETKFHMLID